MSRSGHGTAKQFCAHKGHLVIWKMKVKWGMAKVFCCFEGVRCLLYECMLRLLVASMIASRGG